MTSTIPDTQRVRAFLLILSMLVLYKAGALGQAVPSSAEKAFVSGGRIDMQLESGDYEVRASTDDHIRVIWSPATSTKVTVNTNGTHADIKVADTPHNNFHATIEVPAVADLKIHMTAGDLRVGTIKGSKDFYLRAGDLDVSVGDPNDYYKVSASVRAGDLNAGAFGAVKGGLFRSFTWTGKGKYTLQAHLLAGDLTLRK